MKRSILVLIGLGFLLLVNHQAAALSETTEIDAKINLAKEYLLSPEGPGENAKEGFKILMDAIEMAILKTDYPTEVREKVSTANKFFKEKSIFHHKGVALLNVAYRSVNEGKEFCIPESITRIQQAADYARQQIKTARKSLKQGKVDDSVRLLLEVAIMVVTPMHSKH